MIRIFENDKKNRKNKTNIRFKFVFVKYLQTMQFVERKNNSSSAKIF